MSATHKATFGAGCFWGVEEAFRKVDGVTNTAVGYSGGTTDNPSYEVVCSGRTGHVEVVQVEYDPDVATYKRLLEVFWDNHDPTQLDRQGPDRGTQYRSVIFYHGPDQQASAEASRRAQEGSGRHASPIVTAIEPAREFYRAEEYHQQYLTKRGLGGCRL